MPTSGSKIEIADRIAHFLDTVQNDGEIIINSNIFEL